MNLKFGSRYLAFGGFHPPSGGFADLKVVSDHLPSVLSYFVLGDDGKWLFKFPSGKTFQFDWWHVVDMQDLKIVAGSEDRFFVSTHLLHNFVEVEDGD